MPFLRQTFSCIYQAFEMMFKGLGTKEEVNVEIPFAQVCASECPVTTVMDHFFQPNVPEISAKYVVMFGAVDCF
jgi:hypothetical protein